MKRDEWHCREARSAEEERRWREGLGQERREHQIRGEQMMESKEKREKQRWKGKGDNKWDTEDRRE